MTTWPDRWRQMADFVASWSKDRSRKVGAVIVGPRQELLAIGWNGFPRGVDDDIDARHERLAKYAWTVHAEENAVANAAAIGVSLRGATMYVGGDITWPCARCAGLIVQAGIACLVAAYEDEDGVHEFEVARAILDEAGVLKEAMRAES